MALWPILRPPYSLWVLCPGGGLRSMSAILLFLYFCLPEILSKSKISCEVCHGAVVARRATKCPSLVVHNLIAGCTLIKHSFHSGWASIGH